MKYTAQHSQALDSIRAAVVTYSRGLDQLDGPLLRRAYWPDAVDERFDGDIATYVERAIHVHAQFAWTMHSLHNHVVDFDDSGATARGELYVTAYLAVAEPATLNTFFGRYLDRYAERDGEWRIIRRACVHEGSLTVPMTPAPFPFHTLRQGSAMRPANDRPIGP